MKSLLIVLLFASTTFAMGQGIQHAPTAEQCRADIALWKAESKEGIIALPVGTLIERANYLFDCGQVLSANDLPSAKLADTLRAIYRGHIVNRYERFVERHNLGSQFYDEDAKGAR